LWLLVAMMGIAVTAAIAWSASFLASQRIGLSSEPLAVAAELAPHPPADRQLRRAQAKTHPPRRTRGEANGHHATRGSGSRVRTAAVPERPSSSVASPVASGSAPSPLSTAQSARAPAARTRSSQGDSSGGDGEGGSSGSNSVPDD
jgi:hypothetical protein